MDKQGLLAQTLWHGLVFLLLNITRNPGKNIIRGIQRRTMTVERGDELVRNARTQESQRVTHTVFLNLAQQ